MTVLRLLSLLAAGLVLVLPPMFVFDGSDKMAGMTVIAGLIGMAAIAVSFAYVALAGGRMRRGGQARMLGAGMLTLPALASLALLATKQDFAVLMGSGGFLVFTIVLFLSFVVPATAGDRQRMLRQRERQEAALLKLQHQ